MKPLPMQQIRLQIGLQFHGIVSTTVDRDKSGCEIFQVEKGFDVFRKSKTGMKKAFVPFDNVSQGEYFNGKELMTYEQCERECASVCEPDTKSDRPVHKAKV